MGPHLNSSTYSQQQKVKVGGVGEEGLWDNL